MSFRLSDEQYEAIRSACEHAEVGSISEYTRLAVLQAIKRQRGHVQWWAEDLNTLGQGLLELDEKLSDMRVVLRRLLVGAAPKE